MRDVVRIWCIFFFSFYLRYIVLVHGSCDHYWHTLYLFFSICGCMFFFYLPLTCVVSFLYLCTCFLLRVCNLLFLFHIKMPWWVLFKAFQKYRLLKYSCHKLSSCKVFQEFVLGYILLYLTSEYELNDLWLLSYVHLFVVVLSWIAKGGDC